jgi:hypothetical protein
VRVYLRKTGEAEEFKQAPSVTPKRPTREMHDVVLLEQVFKRLSELAASQEENSDSEPSKLKISLDNCTVVYFPKDSETEEQPPGEASLPGSLEGSTPKQTPYYNLSSPHTLKFIEQAMKSTSPTQPIDPSEDLLIESADHSILLIQPRSIVQEPRNYTNISFNLKVCTRESDSPGGLRSPLNLELLKGKLRELRTDESVAIGDENTRIVVEVSQSNLTSESQSAHMTGTPLCAMKVPDLMSPHTNRKLLRKLQAVQEDLEGEDCVRGVEGSSVLFISCSSDSNQSFGSSLPPSH